MAAIQAESHFKVEDVCGKFNPSKYNSTEIFSAYQNFKIELLDLEECMVQFRYTSTRMYKTLKTRLEGAARDLIREVHPNEGSYERAKRKLDTTYWNKSLHVRDLVHKLKSLPKMDDTSASKVADFVTEALSLMQQLEEILNSRNETPIFLFFSEILVPKFNTLAKDMWEKLSTKDEDDSHALGHSLSLKDLKKVMNKTKSKLRHREYNKIFDGHSRAEKENRETDQKPKQAEEDKKVPLMQEIWSFRTSKNPKETGKKSKDHMEGNNCPVPGCSQKLKKGPRDTTHLYIVQCPQLRKQNPETLLKWFEENGFKCQHCFSKSHWKNECQFREMTCKRLIANSNGNIQYCGRHHHFALHDPRVHGQILQPEQTPYQQMENSQPHSRD